MIASLAFVGNLASTVKCELIDVMDNGRGLTLPDTMDIETNKSLSAIRMHGMQ